MKKKRILFVDDDTNILSGFKRMLRPMRKECEMYFAENGIEALSILEDGPFEVIVSDMKMPQMDGATLLTEVKKKYPKTIRIVLSGHADEEAILRTADITHQFLAKPCETEVLMEVIQRAISLHDLLGDEKLKQLVSNISQLPSLPELYIKINEALKNPEVSTNDISLIIEQDISMSAKILQLVNSSFFGLYKKIETPDRAVKLLGIDTIKTLVLSLHIFTDFKTTIDFFPASNLWTHSIAVAQCAKRIALEELDDADSINACFITGLLHDIGTLVLLTERNNDYKRIALMTEEEDIPLSVSEQRILGTSSFSLGAYLMGLWGMGGSIIEGICFHGRLDEYPHTSFNPALAVHLANVFCSPIKPLYEIEPPPVLNENYITEINLAHKIEAWSEIAEEYLDTLEE